jgi:hypothetical protein
LGVADHEESVAKSKAEGEVLIAVEEKMAQAFATALVGVGQHDRRAHEFPSVDGGSHASGHDGGAKTPP